MRRLLTIVTVFIVVSFALTYTLFSAFSPKAAGPWPIDEPITYYNTTTWDTTLAEAAAQWNRVDAGIKLVATDQRAEADIIVIEREPDALPCAPECVGSATVGYEEGRANVIELLGPIEPDYDGNLDQNYVTTIVHEFGHALGLRHQEEECSVMRSGNRSCPAYDDRFEGGILYHPCGPYPKDLIALADLYDLEQVPDAQPECIDRAWGRSYSESERPVPASLTALISRH